MGTRPLRAGFSPLLPLSISEYAHLCQPGRHHSSIFLFSKICGTDNAAVSDGTACRRGCIAVAQVEALQGAAPTIGALAVASIKRCRGTLGFLVILRVAAEFGERDALDELGNVPRELFLIRKIPETQSPTSSGFTAHATSPNASFAAARTCGVHMPGFGRLAKNSWPPFTWLLSADGSTIETTP
jgi:hypothetical protein